MYFIRHGQSFFNEGFDLMGRDPNMPDARLTERGKGQARKAVEGLRSKGLQRIVSSPYMRAIETAEIIAEGLLLDVEIEPLAGEHRLYSCDIGSPVSALRKSFSCVDFNGFAEEEWWLPFPETRLSLRKRADAFKEKWRISATGERVLFVSHYYFIHAVTGAAADNAELVPWVD